MSLEFTAEVWEALRSHIDFNERSDAADTLINLLIDNNYESDDIKNIFRGDKEVLTALKGYIEEHDIEDEYEDEDYDSNDEGSNSESSEFTTNKFLCVTMDLCGYSLNDIITIFKKRNSYKKTW